jgi:serine/threonine-protein kinase
MSAMSGIEGLPSRYRIESIIGEGGFGKVYRVFDSKLDRVLALKIISRDSTSIRASLMKEFKTLSKLQHPNLVRVYDFGNLESRLFYFTMEYLEGADLRSYCKNADNLKRIPSIIDQLLAALAYLHENGVIHGDIKPENISMTGQKSSPLVKLLDFGLISSIAARQGKNASGTPRFLAPEILYEGARKSHSTDLYALGATLCESIEDLDFPASIDLTDELLKRRYAGMSKTLSGAGVRNPSSVASFILDLCDTAPFPRPASAKVARGSLRT